MATDMTEVRRKLVEAGADPEDVAATEELVKAVVTDMLASEFVERKRDEAAFIRKVEEAAAAATELKLGQLLEASRGQVQRKLSRKAKVKIALVVIAILAALGGYMWYSQDWDRETRTLAGVAVMGPLAAYGFAGMLAHKMRWRPVSKRRQAKLAAREQKLAQELAKVRRDQEAADA